MDASQWATVVLLTIESLDLNIGLIQRGLDTNNIDDLFRGCHNIKGLGFIDSSGVLSLNAQLGAIIEGKTYRAADMSEFRSIFLEMKTQARPLRR